MKAACWGMCCSYEYLSSIFYILAAFYHYSSTRESPNHDYCDPTKCHIYKYKSFDPSKHSLPPAVIKAIRPVYEKMCSDEVLAKVVDGGTTNPNESYHSYIWSLCPKTQFHSAKYVYNAVSLAAVLYNDGYELSIKNLLEKCGIRSSTHACEKMLKIMDNQRIKKHKFKSRATRRKKRLQRILTEQHLNQQEKYDYQSGAYD